MLQGVCELHFYLCNVHQYQGTCGTRIARAITNTNYLDMCCIVAIETKYRVGWINSTRASLHHSQLRVLISA